MTMHDDIRSLRDRYKTTAAEVRWSGKRSAYQLALAEFCDDVAQRLDGILERYEGYVLVPREPAEAMIRAVQGDKPYPRDAQLISSDYRDMIAAAEAGEKQDD